MATRLTNSTRSQIVEHMMGRSAATAKLESLENQHRLIGDRIYQNALSQKAHEAIKSLPADWFISGNSFHIEDITGRVTSVSMSQDRRLPGSRWNPRIRAVCAMPEIDEYLEFGKQVHAAYEERRRIRNNLTSAIGAYSTLEKLIAEWPECKAELPPKLKAPAVKTSTALSVIPALNEALGLPKEEPKQEKPKTGIAVVSKPAKSKLKKAA